jgi:toxin ParE1/3/4
MPAARRVIWSPRAKRDLGEIWRYYQRIASPELADDLLREIARTGAQLSERALMWRARNEISPGLRSVRVRPYAIFYRIAGETIEIARVLHERRDFPALFPDKNNP